MRLRFWLTVLLIGMLLLLALFPALPALFVFKRWLDIREGQDMIAVYHQFKRTFATDFELYTSERDIAIYISVLNH